MGLSIGFSKCSTPPSKCALGTASPLPNPNPRNFEILRHDEVGGWTVVEVRYPDATNYEGRKVMVFHSRFADIAALESLDPHFCDDGHLAPFARFEPTDRGWRAGQALIRSLP